MAVGAPTKFEPQKVETVFSTAVATERYYPRLVRRQLQSELPQTLFQFAVEALRLFFPFEATDEVVCVSMQERAPSTTALEHSLEPQIERVVQVHIRQ